MRLLRAKKCHMSTPPSLFILEIKFKIKGYCTINLLFHSYEYVENPSTICHTET